MSRKSIAPVALVSACMSIAPAALAEGPAAPTSQQAAKIAQAAAGSWTCVASASYRGMFVGTAWSAPSVSRQDASQDALNRCSARAGARACTVRRCWTAAASD